METEASGAETSDKSNKTDAPVVGDKSEPTHGLFSQERPQQLVDESAATEDRLGGHVAEMESESGAETARRRQLYCDKIRQLRKSGETLRADRAQPELWAPGRPDWFDEELFENAKSVYARHFMGVNFAHLAGLLMLVRVHSIYRTLSRTGKSDSVSKLFRRYYQTVIHVKKWYEGDIFKPDSEAQRSLQIVRGMHNKVSRDLNDGPASHTPPVVRTGPQEAQSAQADELANESSRLIAGSSAAENGPESARMHISEYDIMITQFAFVGFIVLRAKQVGLMEAFSRHDLESVLHFWRVIGHYLGASETYNLCARPVVEVEWLCEAIMELEFRQSVLANPLDSGPGVMGVNIVRSVKFLPMLTIYGITKYLYELVGLDTAELEPRANWYSRLSYSFMRLVMTRLLGYRAFRSFNNGLTRLSVHLVGKVEDWFARRLDSKYGQELRL